MSTNIICGDCMQEIISFILHSEYLQKMYSCLTERFTFLRNSNEKKLYHIFFF